jgi:hypothetical protein
MPLSVEDCGKSRGERCRCDPGELHALRPAALTGGDGDGACWNGERVGERSDERLIRRTVYWRSRQLDDQLPLTHTRNLRAPRAWGDTYLAGGAVRG